MAGRIDILPEQIIPAPEALDPDASPASRIWCILSCESRGFLSGKKGKMMRCLLFCLAWLPVLSIAQTSPDVFSREKFEKRFHAADKDGDGMLSRAEAYAEFPRAPRFFDEIDLDHDGYIKLAEVDEARNRRVEAAISASGIGGGARYVEPEYLKDERAVARGNSEAEAPFAGNVPAHRDEFYESLVAEHDHAVDSGAPAAAEIVPNLLNKSF